MSGSSKLVMACKYSDYSSEQVINIISSDYPSHLGSEDSIRILSALTRRFNVGSGYENWTRNDLEVFLEILKLGHVADELEAQGLLLEEKDSCVGFLMELNEEDYTELELPPEQLDLFIIGLDLVSGVVFRGNSASLAIR